MEGIRLIGTVGERLGYVFLKYSSDDDVDYSLRRGANISEQGRLKVREWFVTNLYLLPSTYQCRLKTLKRFIHVLRAYHAIALRSERIP